MHKLSSILGLPVVLLLAFTFGLVSCGDDKDDDNPAPATTTNQTSAREKFLTGGSSKNWMLTAWTTFQQGTNTDSYLTLDPCDRDDITTFFANKTQQKTDGQTKCDPNVTQLHPGTWVFQKNETELKLISPLTGTDVTYRLKQLSATTLVVDLPILVISPGDTIISTYTFTAQ